MARLNAAISSIASLSHGSDTWRIRVRVLRMWEMCPVAEPTKPFAVQLVLIDAAGNRIEATIRKTLIKKLFGEVVEGNIYRITYFSVVPNVGAYKAARRGFKILFNSRTKIVPDESPLIPMYGFTFMNSAEIAATMGNSEHLTDMIGLVNGVSREKQYVKGSTITRMIELELTDDRGRIQCALFGSYVDIVNEYVQGGGQATPVAIVQYAKIKTYKGNVVIQNVMHATNLLWNPDIPEAHAFRSSLAAHGIDAELPMAELADEVQVVSLEEEFLTMFSRKGLDDLHATEEAGTYVAKAKIISIVEGEKWWYSSCRCHKSVSLEDGVYFCYGCDMQVLEVTPRFRLKVEVSDGVEEANFVIFDSDCQNLMKKTCKELVVGSKGKASDVIPEVIRGLVGKEFLFKVEKFVEHGKKYDDSFKVKKVCDDLSIIKKFTDSGKVCTPKKAVVGSKFTVLDDAEAAGKSPGIIADYSDGVSEISNVSLSLEDMSPEGSFSATRRLMICDSDDDLLPPAKKLRPVKIEKE